MSTEQIPAEAVEARARAWREHVATKRSARNARKSSFEAGWDAATHHPARVLPSVEDAKAEAQRRWPDYPHVGFSGADDRQQAFIEGAKWALDQAPTVQQVRAEAWDEGFSHGILGHLLTNPYRARSAETEGE